MPRKAGATEVGARRLLPVGGTGSTLGQVVEGPCKHWKRGRRVPRIQERAAPMSLRVSDLCVYRWGAMRGQQVAARGRRPLAIKSVCMVGTRRPITADISHQARLPIQEPGVQLFYKSVKCS